MPRSCRSYAFFLLAFLLCCTDGISRAQSTADTIYHLHGTVLDEVTGKPVGRALVSSMDRRIAAMTDGQGHFNIDLSVPARSADTTQARPVSGSFANRLVLTAQRPGYLTLQEQAQLSLDDSLNTTDVVLRLLPAGTVSGRVTVSGMDSAQGVRVSLLHHSVLDGGYMWVPAGQHSVGTDGQFRFTNLQPGEYTLMTAEWAGGEPGNVQRTSITRQYPPDFLGDVRTLTRAAKLQLNYGGDERVELHLRDAAYYPIAVPVQNQPANAPINVRVQGADAMNGYQLGWNARDGAVEGALPSGNYTLLLTSFGPQQGSATVPLTVANQPLEHAPVTLAAGSRIPIRVHTEFTQQASQPAGGTAPTTTANLVQLYLRPVEDTGTFGGSSVRHGEDSEPALENVQPGSYTVRTNCQRGYVSSITSGSIDLLRNPLTVGDGGAADPIDVTLRDDGATLNGTIDFGSEHTTAQFTSLLLVPLDGTGDAIRSIARTEGKFTLQNVPPGSYRLFAVAGRRGLELPYRDALAMRAFAGKGTAVTVSAGQTATVDTTAISQADLEKE